MHKFIGHVKSYYLDNYVHVAPKPNCIMLYGRDNTLNINKQSGFCLPEHMTMFT